MVSDQDGAMLFAKPLANGDVAVALYNAERLRPDDPHERCGRRPRRQVGAAP